MNHRARVGAAAGWLAASFVFHLVAQAALFTAAASRTAAHSRRARRFERRGSRDAAHVLVIGDRTRVGVGACEPDASFAGLLGREFGEAQVDNRSVNGAAYRHCHDPMRSKVPMDAWLRGRSGRSTPVARSNSYVRL